MCRAPVFWIRVFRAQIRVAAELPANTQAIWTRRSQIASASPNPPWRSSTMYCPLPRSLPGTCLSNRPTKAPGRSLHSKPYTPRINAQATGLTNDSNWRVGNSTKWTPPRQEIRKEVSPFIAARTPICPSGTANHSQGARLAGGPLMGKAPAVGASSSRAANPLARLGWPLHSDTSAVKEGPPREP